MFTGIIKELGKVERLDKRGINAILAIAAPVVSADSSLGDSISVNGVCLTVSRKKDQSLEFDISGETMAVTDLRDLEENDRVNLEPALRLMDFIGGHLVSGHVEGVGEILSKVKKGDDIVFRIKSPREITAVTIPRGSIAVDGISLTVTKIFDEAFEVVIIPHTASVTTLGIKKTGDRVNLESDLIGRYIKRIIENQSLDSGKKTGEMINDFINKAF